MQEETERCGDSDGPGLDPAEVCTLTADGLGDRMAWIQREILPHAVETGRLERGLAIEMAAAPGLEEKLDRLIQLERECCSEIVFERCESAVPGRLRLEVRGVDPDAAVFHSFHVPRAKAPVRARLAKAAGTGVMASVFVCCVLPVAAVALVGAVAAPLVALDGPGPIAAGALGGGFAAWRWLGRRSCRGAGPEAPDSACGPGC